MIECPTCYRMTSKRNSTCQHCGAGIKKGIALQNTGTSAEESPISLKDWMAILIIIVIPGINVLMLLLWAFGTAVAKTQRNFARAALIMLAAGAVLTGVATIFFLMYAVPMV